ncbi:50S ribosomal protein L10 [Candidatus Giovannonibacteria bacterium]|nr:50S ribosomal protein L10 [Candidatus Giovannonibacteria bacterium]
MTQTRSKKESLVSEMKDLFEKASILVFVNFHGLSVVKQRKLRKELRKIGSKYKVVKKTLLKRAFEALGLKNSPSFEGEIGIVSGYQDVIVPPQVISKFIRENKELKIVGGLYENNFVDAGVIGRLSAIPSREILLSQLAFMLSQPVAGLARALNEIGKTLEKK